jgi:hypothetical protein
MVPVLRAQLLVVLGRYREATELFDVHLARARSEGMAHREARLLADRAWCHVNERRIADALRDARLAELALPKQPDPDDLAAAHGRLASVYARCERALEAEIHAAQAQDALLAHQASQAQMLAALDRALDGLA